MAEIVAQARMFQSIHTTLNEALGQLNSVTSDLEIMACRIGGAVPPKSEGGSGDKLIDQSPDSMIATYQVFTTRLKNAADRLAAVQSRLDTFI
jgi:hypothetical protein